MSGPVHGAAGRPAVRDAALVAAGYAALLLAVYRMVWWGDDGGRWFFGWDCLREYWPDMVFGMRALADGELPAWNPYALGGYSFAGDAQAGTFAPVNWLLWLLGGLGLGQGAWMIQAKVLINLWIGLTGMHALGYRRTRVHAAAAIAAVVFVFGSPLLVHKNGAFLWPFLYLPWAVLALERYAASPTARRGAVLGGAVWLCGSAGHPQGFFYDLVVLALYWAYLTLGEPRQAWPRLRRQWPGALAAICVTLLALLPVYLPSLEAVAWSPRANRGVGYVMQGPLTPQALYELFVPNLDKNWQLDIYVGPLALALAAYGALAAPDRRARVARIFWLVVAALGVLLALGKHTPVLPLFYDHVPGFTLFRIAYRHKLIFGFAIAVAAADGAGALARGEGARWARWALAGIGSVWLAGVLGARLGLGGAIADGPPASAAVWALVLGGGAVGLAVAAAFDGGRRRVYLVAAAALVMADLWVAGGRKLEIMQRPPDLARDRELVGAMEGVATDWRYHNDGVLAHATPYLLDVREMSGFLNPVRLARQQDVTERAKRQPLILSRFGVRYLVRREPPPANLGMSRVAPLIWEFRAPTPLLRVYPRAEALSGAAALDRLAAPAPLMAALVDPADAPPGLPDGVGSPVDGRLLRYHRNRLELEVSAPVAGVAVINESYFPGWRAWVNGAEAPVFRANHYARGVVVPAGASRIVLEYTPSWYHALLTGFALSLVLLAVAAFGRWRWLQYHP